MQGTMQVLKNYSQKHSLVEQISKIIPLINRVGGCFYIFNEISLELLKEWFMTTFLRSDGVSISNSSSAVHSNMIHNCFICSMLGSLIPCS